MAKKEKTGQKREANVLMIVICVVLAVYALTLIVPLLWAFFTSLKSIPDYNKNILGFPNPELSSEELKFQNYVVVFNNFRFPVDASYFTGLSLNRLVGVSRLVGFWEVVLNSVIYSVGGALVSAVVPCLVGYLCAKYRFKFSNVIYAIVIFVMVMPIVGATPARITLLRRLGLFDSLAGDLVTKLSFTNMYFLVFYAFFQGIPDSFAEAAEVDGASQLRIMVSIMFPLAIKMITTVALILFVQYWNDYNTPYMYLPTHPTLSYSVFRLVLFTNFQGNTPDAYKLRFTPAQIAACMMLAVPIIVVFVAFKDKLMGNISLGGVKG